MSEIVFGKRIKTMGKYNDGTKRLVIHIPKDYQDVVEEGDNAEIRITKIIKKLKKFT